jgi:hypothetical protein
LSNGGNPPVTAPRCFFESSSNALANTNIKWFYPASLRAGELMHIFMSTMLASSLLVTGAFADTPLAPGKPAGVKQAQLTNRDWEFLVIGVGLVVGVAAAVILQKDDNTSSSGTSAH